LGQIVGTVAELRPQVVLAEAKAAKLRADLSRFEVVEAYREMSDQAAGAKTEIQAISRRAVSLKETLEHLRAARATEHAPQRNDVTRLYEAVGVELPGSARRRFDEVDRFHQSVVENRRSHLQEEIAGIERELADGETRMATLSDERAEILRILEGRGALEDFTALQKRLADAEAEAAGLRHSYESAEELEGETTELDIDRANIKRRLQEDHHNRREKLDRAILIIANAIEELYADRQGKFEVEATDNGPEFRISTQGDRGGGIANMEIFCLDLALFTIWTSDKAGPAFLVHDSHLYDGVDPRQATQAWALGAQAAVSNGGQYIVLLNSDVFDTATEPGSNLAKAVLSTSLSDRDDTGGLFGMRFD
jgi:uncharacterized protein YydD (DUF2326 family)